jgi:hypothetical protein
VISCECSWQAKWSLRRESHKLILAREEDYYGTPMRELYDLAGDPRETRNLAGEQAALADEMATELEAWIEERVKTLGKSGDPLREQGVSMKWCWDME